MRGACNKNVIAVCGVKNSGKTTLIEAIVRHLTAEGVRVAVIKHDGHDFTCDVPGTDSAAFSAAGAYGVAVFSEKRIFVHKTGGGEDETYLQSLFPEADLILIEGCKDSTYPKIEVIRKEISGTPVSNPEGRFLIVTDDPAAHFAEETLSFAETERIAGIVWHRAQRES
ncbi:MAG: molybdopterin-guanine dinucleotide biosynthesis protein B [Lachnospiraceae bacterium]|nr:molybdopterin-guanine dinucleotide biosynthesis protein B [Lachnospiraceae bacterium]